MIPHISANQLAKYSSASQAVKSSILKQQIKPNKFLIPWYQSAKGSIKKFLREPKDLKPLLDGIKKVKLKTPENSRQIIDKEVSLQALETVINLPIANILALDNYEVVKIDVPIFTVEGVEISVSPEVIFKAKVKGKTVYGGMKFHIAKNDKFDFRQCKLIATVLYKYISSKFHNEVDPKLCFCVDVFSERIIFADQKPTAEIYWLKEICTEIRANWPIK